MKKLKHFVPAILACIVIFSSCTMEKRLYRPGYHVHHKKSPVAPTAMETEKQEPAAYQNGATSEKNPKTVYLNTAMEQLVTPSVPKPEKAIPEIKSPEAVALPVSNSDTKNTIGNPSSFKDHTGKQNSLSDTKKSYSSKALTNSGGDGGGGIGRGILMLIVALLLLGLGALFSSLIGGSFGLLVFWFFGLAALILIIAAIIVMVRG
ncbi:MAG: hypothetical protein K0S33_3472 [Bacteroidetes bacterium]|jgi:hypothetical protein|nr:hypothetical protein [Bacteroidota bacterium]